MSRKKIAYMYITASLISIIIFILSLGTSFRTKPVQLNSSPSAETSAASEIQNGYILGEYEGCLALYRSGSSTPYCKLDYSTSMLTDFDKELVSKGIYADTREEINKLIEDFIS